MWLEVEYLPTSLFSFKNINATNTAATSLLFPTPFGVKMGLVSQTIQNYNLDKGKEVFEMVKNREIRFSLSEEAVVNKTFGRITDLRNRVGRSKPAYREYVFLKGSLKVAIEISNLEDDEMKLLKRLFIRINYFGKKGSFMQFKSFNQLEELDEDYLNQMGEENLKLANKSIIQFTEDIPPKANFEAINIYNSDEKLDRKNNERIFVVNIEQTLSGEGYQYYKLCND
ncbi:hypothetical protein [Selenihalanaerobacter shriftii]|uniref:CRISPR-associated protein, Cas5t family n=1 Tax=Selenihalanaerobacter shriftii TaxID=142842 RepID=A0A1T4PHX8_9FIRM|nr:hypothetical protein [Selenihalanaerobacter shriftii]SJZ91021.1 hypothetical protein SAMN02745118_02169 [Selenihalanaerobacter shriftii]